MQLSGRFVLHFYIQRTAPRLHPAPAAGQTEPKKLLPRKQQEFFSTGTALSSQAVASQVFSTLMSLTSVFGMGTGGTSSPLAPIQDTVLSFPTRPYLTLNRILDCPTSSQSSIPASTLIHFSRLASEV